MQCFRRWYYEYELFLDPYPDKPLPEELVIGKAYHAYRAEQEPEETHPKAEVMIKAYRDVEPWLAEMHVLEAEKVYVAQIDENTYLAGRVDGIVILPDLGVKAVLEIKTSRYKPNEGYWRIKELDPQLSLYCLLTDLNYIVLDFTRVPSIKDEERWYDDMIEKPETYFQRVIIHRTDMELQRFKKDLLTWLTLINTQLKAGWFLRNATACNEYNRPCPFYKLCRGEVPLDTWPRKQIKFEELQPELSEILGVQ